MSLKVNCFHLKSCQKLSTTVKNQNLAKYFQNFPFYSTRTLDFQENSEDLQLSMIIDDKADGNDWMIYFCEDIARSADCSRENSRPGSSTASDRAGTLGAEVERA